MLDDFRMIQQGCLETCREPRNGKGRAKAFGHFNPPVHCIASFPVESCNPSLLAQTKMQMSVNEELGLKNCEASVDLSYLALYSVALLIPCSVLCCYYICPFPYHILLDNAIDNCMREHGEPFSLLVT